MHGNIDDVKGFLDDAIDETREAIAILERKPAMHTAHAHTALETLQKVRKEVEWIEHEGYISHRDCARNPDDACDECLAEWAAIAGEPA